MNFRKFYFIVCSILSIFMFLIGSLTLVYINFNADIEKPANSSGALIHDILSPFKASNEDLNVLLLGGDKVNNNTDTIMLVNFKPSSSKVSILSIPRDTSVHINGKRAKINAAYPRGGGELAIQTVSELLGINVEYYVFIDTSAFRETIDILGGVDYYVPVDMHYDDPLQSLSIHIKKGQHHFDGTQAEKFMRFRQNNNGTINEYYDGSDLKRIDAQQNFIRELVRQKLNIIYLTKTNDIVNTIFSNIDTNLNMSEVLKLTGSVSKVQADSINMLMVPGKSVLDGAWYYIMDSNEADKIVKEYFRSKN